MDSEVRELGQVCTFQRGLTYAKGDEVDQSRNVVLRANNISMLTNALDFTELKYIKDSITIPESKLVRRDTLMICTASGSKSHLGKVAYVDKDYGYAFGGFMGLLVPEDEVYARYVYYSMLSENYKEFIGDLSDGTNINNLKWDDLKLFTLPVPPLSEQYRIVSKLDAAFAALGEAEANVERNRANARELFESYLNGVFEGGEIDAELMRLGDVCKTGSGSTPLRSRKDYYEGGNVPWLLSGEVAQGEVTKATNFITELALKETSVKMFPPGTVLVAMYGATAGEVGILRFPSTTNQAVCGIHPSDQFIPEYLYFVFLQKKAELVAQAVGGAQPNISQEKIKNTLIPVPTIKQQAEVVKRLEAVRHQASQLEANYQQKLRELEGLKKGLLGAAFRGEL